MAMPTATDTAFERSKSTSQPRQHYDDDDCCPDDPWEAVEWVMDRYGRGLLGVARRHVDAASADDLLQDTSLALQEQYEEVGVPKQYLRAHAFSFLMIRIKRFKQRAARRREVVTPFADREVRAMPSDQGSRIVDRILEEIEALPETQSVVMALVVFEDLDTNEIATRLGVKLDAVYKRLSRARIRLEKRFNNCDELRTLLRRIVRHS